MRAQLSLELLIYMSLAGISFLLAISAASSASAGEAKSIQAFEVSQFVSSVGTELAAGSTSSFSAFLPRGLCNYTLKGDSLLTAFGAFSIPEPLNSPPGTFCPDGVYAELRLTYGSGGAVLEREG